MEMTALIPEELIAQLADIAHNEDTTLEALLETVIAERQAQSSSMANPSVTVDRFFDYSIDMMCITTPEGQFVRVNRAFINTLGYDEAFLFDSCIEDLLHPDDVNATLPALQMTRNEQPVHYVENRYRLADGGYRWLGWTFYSEIDGYIYSVVRDIHDRKHLQGELQQQMTKMITLLDHISDGFYSLDENLRFTYVNPSAARLLNCDNETLLNQDIFRAFPQMKGTEFEKYYRQALVTGDPANFTAHYEALGMWFEINIYPTGSGLTVYLRDVTGQRTMEHALRDSMDSMEHEIARHTRELLKAAQHLNVEMHERRQAQDLLIQSESRLTGVLDIAAEAILVIDQEFRIQRFSQGAEALFGYNAMEVMEKPLEMILTNEDLVNLRIDAFRQLSYQVPYRNLMDGKRKNGEVFPAETSISRLSLHGETIFTAIIRDVTAEQK